MAQLALGRCAGRLKQARTREGRACDLAASRAPGPHSSRGSQPGASVPPASSVRAPCACSPHLPWWMLECYLQTPRPASLRRARSLPLRAWARSARSDKCPSAMPQERRPVRLAEKPLGPLHWQAGTLLILPPGRNIARGDTYTDRRQNSWEPAAGRWRSGERLCEMRLPCRMHTRARRLHASFIVAECLGRPARMWWWMCSGAAWQAGRLRMGRPGTPVQPDPHPALASLPGRPKRKAERQEQSRLICCLLYNAPSEASRWGQRLRTRPRRQQRMTCRG